jgi:ferredoxin
MASWEIGIDRTKCDGHGVCAELLPERIRLDDWGYPIIHPAPVSGSLVPLARRAVRSCPLLALRLTAARDRAVSERGGST